MKDIICLVGAGGKTTLMQRLAAEAAEKGIQTVITTTTHIQRPGSFGMGEWTLLREDDGLLVYENNGVILLGQPCGKGKLSSVFAEEYKDDSDMPVTHIGRLLPQCSAAGEYLDRAELIFVEADGSKRRPFKMPRKNEPVILSECTKVIAVMGMSSIGKSLEEAGFGFEPREPAVEASAIITPEMLADILTEYDGAYKGVGNRDYTIVLNQCDNDYRKGCAKSTAKAIHNAIEHMGTDRRCKICTAVNGNIIDRREL